MVSIEKIREQKEREFGDKILKMNKHLRELQNKKMIFDNSDKEWVSEYYNTCKEMENYYWNKPDKKNMYYSNYSHASFYYANILCLDLMDPGTNQYKKHILKDENEPIVENVLKSIELLKQALEYNEKLTSINELSPFHDILYRNAHELLKRDILTKLGTLYSLYVDVDEGIKYYENAADLNEINALQSLVYIYSREEYFDLDKSLAYYQILKQNHKTAEQTLFALAYLFNYFFNNGLYKEAKNHIDDYKNEVLPNLKNDEHTEFATKCLNELENIINQKTEKTSSFDNLKMFFPDEILSKMESNIKVFISTSLELKKYIDEQNAKGNVLDYSGATMPVMKALESVLFDIFGRHYLSYLKTIKELDLSKIDNCFKKETFKGSKEYKLVDIVNVLELGSILHLIGKYYVNFQNGEIINIEINPYFKEFCVKKCKIDNADEFIASFVEKLYQIKEKRNETAHKKRIYKEDAEIVSKELIEQYKFIKKIYEMFEILF